MLLLLNLPLIAIIRAGSCATSSTPEQKADSTAVRGSIGGRMATTLRKLLMIALAAVLPLVLVSPNLLASSKARDFSNNLDGAERRAFEAWYVAQIAHRSAVESYWRTIDRLRQRRRRKKRQRQRLLAKDYAVKFPPVYNGPKLQKSLLRRWRRFRDKDAKGPATRPQLPGVRDYLAAAKRHYNFTPERIPEREYKRRYAREALSLGLTKDQVVRVFALETGGNGTADMQAGIHPISKKGRPISSALGYAQLLAANSINVMAKHGPAFVRRLKGIIKRERVAERRQQLSQKLAALRAMLKTSKSIPYKWSRQRALAKTSRGMGLHPLNIDGLIGPWMQVTKLADIKRLAASRGLHNLSGAELELMNLAGPGTGLEMMKKVARDKPTTNFFSRRAYYRNSIVRGRTSKGLIVALNQRMDANLKKDGSRQFLAVFDELIAVRQQHGHVVPTSISPPRPALVRRPRSAVVPSDREARPRMQFPAVEK